MKKEGGGVATFSEHDLTGERHIINKYIFFGKKRTLTIQFIFQINPHE